MKLKPYRDGKGAVITSMDPDGLAGKTEKLKVDDRLLKIMVCAWIRRAGDCGKNQKGEAPLQVYVQSSEICSRKVV